MKVLIVDDEQMGIDGLTESVTEALGKEIELHTFLDPKEALATLQDEITKLYPDYTAEIVPDVDISD